MQSQSLKNYRWKNRVIVLVAKKKDSKAFQMQLEAIVSKESELKDRDLITILLSKDSVELRNELKIGLAFEGIILIGKDGGVKMREEFHVAPKKIFDLIDSMPMRRTEMRN